MDMLLYPMPRGVRNFRTVRDSRQDESSYEVDLSACVRIKMSIVKRLLVDYVSGVTNCFGSAC